MLYHSEITAFGCSAPSQSPLGILILPVPYRYTMWKKHILVPALECVVFLQRKSLPQESPTHLPLTFIPLAGTVSVTHRGLQFSALPNMILKKLTKTLKWKLCKEAQPLALGF